jgi:hypothetical protein
LEDIVWRSLRNDPPPLDAVVCYRGPTRGMSRLILNARYTRYRRWVYIAEWVMAPWRIEDLRRMGFTKWTLLANPPVRKPTQSESTVA